MRNPPDRRNSELLRDGRNSGGTARRKRKMAESGFAQTQSNEWIRCGGH